MAVGNKVFAPAIFFIAAREALEASLVIGILSGMLENLVMHTKSAEDLRDEASLTDHEREQADLKRRTIVRKLRKVVLLGALTGLLIAFAIGAAFLAVFYTQVNDLYGKAEELWEGIFNLVAVLLITPMSLAILRAGNSKRKWKRKLESAFNDRHIQPARLRDEEGESTAVNRGISSNDTASSSSSSARRAANASGDDEAHPKTTATEKLNPLEAVDVVPTMSQSAQASRPRRGLRGLFSKPSGAVSDLKLRMNRGTLALFTIPLITTLREGLEGVVFIGGVSLGLPATSIPLPAIVGLGVGLLIGYLIFRSGNVLSVRIFLVGSTCFLLLIASGMASRAVYYLQFYAYVRLVGDSAAESGDGPGSYNSQGYIWHLNCCNPEANKGGSGWGILNSLVGWNNTATYGSVFMYIGYWFAVAGYLWYQIWREGRLALRWNGNTVWESQRAIRMREAKQLKLQNRLQASQVVTDEKVAQPGPSSLPH
ncbi:high-affinity iron permease CaFTR1 [Moesziomyces antarcticus]|uniref:Probable high-affinity iron permease n=1 Tax=Pseudozyma antarctica TaxID=84753 RepID=A0A5C3FG52_PSEA2|nr:high-affinity iron permease CaFTR1 [Moesziomyces antarcticus]GAK62571.1 high-affinity iron permease CaFTR1 [Moesziomyces antarcticus]SPO43126.1 probable high-affinity iron permease [Moesziomyces antarcticus]